MVSKFIHAALNHQEIAVYGDGNQTRTFLFIDDNISATLHALNNRLFLNEVVNIGSDEEITIIDLAKKIIRITNSESKSYTIHHLKKVTCYGENRMQKR